MLFGLLPTRRSTNWSSVYEATYDVAPSLRAGGADREALREAARIEVALREFMDEGGFGAITDTFENLDGLKQLPGIAAQRLMADGYGFGAEGDWKTAVMVRLVKVMARGLSGRNVVHGGLHLPSRPGRTESAGRAHARGLPIHLGWTGLVRDPSAVHRRQERPGPPGLRRGLRPGHVAALMDMGDRFRILANEIDLVPPDKPMGKLPVGRAVWKPRPDFATATECWLMAGGSHHTVLSTGRWGGDDGRLRRDGRLRVPADRRRHDRWGLQERASVERGLLPPGRRPAMRKGR